MNTNTLNQQIADEVPLPLTPRDEGKIQFLGPDIVKYISPPRNRASIAPPPYHHPHQLCQQPQMIYHQPQQMAAPQMMQPIMYAQPVMMAPQVPFLAPQLVNNSPPSTQNINVCVNSPPSTIGGSQGVDGGGGGGGALVCPKCRKGIVTRQQDKKRRKLLIFLTICCCPITCGLPLLCLRCNFIDACACCGKGYGHRGRKTAKNKVHAVKL